MNAFDQMSVVLQRRYREPGASRSEAMRQALRDGAMTAAELAKVAGVGSATVSALLKYDIGTGRVRVSGSPRQRLYELSTDFDDDLQREIFEAKSLLSRHGYIVRKRSPQ